MKNPCWAISEYAPQHTQELRQVYMQARRFAFPWINPDTFYLHDFDAVTEDETLLVAISQNVPVGFIAWWPPDNFIHSLFVSPAFTGKGIGKSLLNACLEKISRPATLKCLQKNERALNFYRSQGWIITAEGESEDGFYFLLSFE
ncbi:GNAT family N-acetyltransferase [Dyadobacter sediminis]|uniref:GNAT family N-acetyltransferase n=1 Tax=Dyadobacter sediminis TaxID=1493691 RepID=A0A5R9K6Q6_9BACT|nr:GNAT family N-acetyltransferase [Dyadobacter sediminis]TLU89458.1 GNAT family N-acetyltransferase [Dyadobacter sediminis]GGC05238.1 GCN5 family acetyltransferase [Dyadobacter sediminis]